MHERENELRTIMYDHACVKKRIAQDIYIYSYALVKVGTLPK